MNERLPAEPSESSELEPGVRLPDGYFPGRWFSFKAAVSGALYTLRTQPNARIELIAILVVAMAGWWLEISRVEWILLGLTGAMVFALEAINTAIEAVVDLASPNYHPLAKRSKDAAAGAMIFAVLGSLWVALLVFGPKLWERLL